MARGDSPGMVGPYRGPPVVQRPTYLDGAPIPDSVSSAVGDACTTAATKAAPIASLVGASLLGATAAYFVPMIWDAVLLQWGRYSDQGESEHVDLDVEPRDD